MDYPKISPRAARVNAGFSQREAAKLLGIDVSTLKNYECGRTMPNIETVDKMGRVYAFPSDYIFFARKLPFEGSSGHAQSERRS